MDTNVSVSNSIGKDMKEMSFVGLHATKSGIIAFADSKASLSYGAGFIEDKKRGQIQKIFYNEKFIFVYHGNNELFKEHIKIEDYILNHLRNYDYFTFFDRLFHRLKLSQPDYNDGKYYFIIGAFQNNGEPFLQEVILDCHANAVIYKEKKDKYSVIYGGDELYLRMYDIIPKYNDMPVDIYASIIKKQIESMVDIFDADVQYNTVGKPIQIEIFK